MKIVVFGASGGVGLELVAQAEALGHAVVAVAREGSPVGAAKRVLRLDVAKDPLEPALEGADVVLSALGIRRRQVWNPWSAVTSPVDLCSASARRIVAGMREVGVPRLIAVSAAGVAESGPAMNGLMRGFVASSSIGVAYRDLAVMEGVYGESRLDTCCVRPVTLTWGPRTERVREVDHFGALMQISRADVAWWMLERAEGKGAPPGACPQIAGA